MEKICSLFKELDIEKIDYIGIRVVKLIKPKYSIVIGYNFNEINILETETTDEIKIIRLLTEIKEQFKKYDNFISIDKYSPLINIYRAKNIELRKCKFVDKNYLIITMQNGEVYLTKRESISKIAPNKWQIANFKYWSRRNDRLYEK